jgi:hypothetical protein
MADAVADEPKQPEPVIEPMPEASGRPVTSVPPLVGKGPAGRHHHAYRGRFLAFYLGLGAVVAGAAVFFVLVVTGGSTPAGPAWSAWQPKDGARLDEAGEIASHIAPLYRIAPGGAQLVAVKATPPEVQNIPVEEVALKGGSAKEDYRFVPTKDAVVYQLCGLGTRCAIAGGTPSTERARLLRREALELALYTFKYVGGVDSVVVHIPPPPEPNTDWALFFQKSELSNELSRPLARTLPTAKRGTALVPASVVGNADQRTVERLTRERWFTSQYQQLPDGNAILVLDPVIAAG